MFPAIYVFGDSLVDVGNNNYLKMSLSKANFPHNGIDFPDKKSDGGFAMTRILHIFWELKPALGINYTYSDTFSIFSNIAQNPASYGFTEIQASCCGLGYLNAQVTCLPFSSYCSNRREHVFWDRVHPTEASHRIMVDELFEGSKYTVPMNVKQLASL